MDADLPDEDATATLVDVEPLQALRGNVLLKLGHAIDVAGLADATSMGFVARDDRLLGVGTRARRDGRSFDHWRRIDEQGRATIPKEDLAAAFDLDPDTVDARRPLAAIYALEDTGAVIIECPAEQAVAGDALAQLRTLQEEARRAEG